MISIAVDTAVDDDLPQIFSIEQESITPPWNHLALLSELHREDSFFAVAMYSAGIQSEQQVSVHRVVLGFVVLRRMGDEGELLRIAVDKAVRRCGVADMLMCAALRNAGEFCQNSIYLEVRSSNEAAISLYKKHGFTYVRQRKRYYDNPVEDAVVMMSLLGSEAKQMQEKTLK